MAQLLPIITLCTSAILPAQEVYQDWTYFQAVKHQSVEALCGLGDLDGDGIADFAAGWPNGEQTEGWTGGFVSIHSGATGAKMKSFAGRPGAAKVGSKLSTTADYDQDGLPDLLVGSPFAHGRAPASGAATLYSSKRGTPIFQFSGNEPYSEMGSSVLGLGDINNDQWPDIAIGAKSADGLGKDCGAVYLYSGFDGQLLGHIQGDETGAMFGSELISVGDLNQDGATDFAVSAPGQATGSAGFVEVYSGANLTRLFRFEGMGAQGGFGFSICNPGDLNQDNVSELVIAEPFLGNGLVRVFSLSSGVEMYSIQGLQAGGQLGYSLAAAGDFNKDGVLDFACGAPKDAQGGNQAGAVAIINGETGAFINWIYGNQNQGLGSCISSAHPWALTAGVLVGGRDGIYSYRPRPRSGGSGISVSSGSNNGSYAYTSTYQSQQSSYLYFVSLGYPWYYRPYWYPYCRPSWWYSSCSPYWNSSWNWWWSPCWMCGNHYCCCDDNNSSGGGNGGPPPPPPNSGPRKVVPSPLVNGGSLGSGAPNLGNEPRVTLLPNRPAPAPSQAIVLSPSPNRISKNNGSESRPTPSPRPSVSVPRPKPSPRPSVSVPRPTPSPRPSVSVPRPTPSPRPSVSVPRPTPSPRPSVSVPRPKPSPRPSVSVPRPKPSPRPSVSVPRPKPSPRPRPRPRAPLGLRKQQRST